MVSGDLHHCSISLLLVWLRYGWANRCMVRGSSRNLALNPGKQGSDSPMGSFSILRWWQGWFSMLMTSGCHWRTSWWSHRVSRESQCYFLTVWLALDVSLLCQSFISPGCPCFPWSSKGELLHCFGEVAEVGIWQWEITWLHFPSAITLWPSSFHRIATLTGLIFAHGDGKHLCDMVLQLQVSPFIIISCFLIIVFLSPLFLGKVVALLVEGLSWKAVVALY